MPGREVISSEGIQGRIHTVRGLQVMLDSHLADLYRVEVKMLNRAVKRNLDRFPAAFMFQLSRRRRRGQSPDARGQPESGHIGDRCETWFDRLTTGLRKKRPALSLSNG